MTTNVSLLAMALALMPAAQDASVERAVAGMEARAPRFKDLELRYVGRLFGDGEVDIGGELRLLIVPGKGIRSDTSVLSFRSTERSLQELEADASTTEIGDDLYFWGAVHRGPATIHALLPPCLSMRGRRADYPATLDLFPADFPFRWVADDGLPLLAAAPELAFAREPGWAASGRRTLEGKEYSVFELKRPYDRLPVRSIVRSFPIAAPLKRLYVDPKTRRPVRLDLEMREKRSALRISTRVTEWAELAGGAVPRRLETRYEQGRDGQWRDTGMRMVKHLVASRVDRGLTPADLLPPDRRDDVHTDAVMNPTEFYRAAARRAPRDPAPWAHLALAHYRDAIEQALKGGRGLKVDPATVIGDLERAQRLAPASPFVILSLLRLYEAAGRADAAAALVKAVEGHPVESPDVRLALADYWVKQGKGEHALKQLERVSVNPGASLRLRLRHGRLKMSALAFQGNASDAAETLRSLFDAGEEERELLVQAFAPVPFPQRGSVADPDPGLAESLRAALEKKGAPAELRRMALRLAFRNKDVDAFGSALESWLEAGAKGTELEDAVRLALRLRSELKVVKPVVEKLAGRIVEALPGSPAAWTLRALALGDSGEAEEARTAWGRALDAMEDRPLTDETVASRAQSLRLLSDQIGDAGDASLLGRVARLFVACLNRSARPYGLLRGGTRDPVSRCVAALLAKSRHVEAFGVLKDLKASTRSYLYGLRQVLRPHDNEFYRAIREHLEKTSKDPEDYRKLARMALRNRSRSGEAVELLEKAHALAPDDAPLALELARACEGAGGRRERAIEVYEELLRLLDRDPKAPGDRNHTLFQIGRLHHEAGRKERAVATLDKIDLKAEGMITWLSMIAKMYEEAGSEDRAIKAYRRFLEGTGISYKLASSGAFARLGKLHEKRREFEEAYRVYSRGIEAYRQVKERYGPTAIPRRPNLPGTVQEETDPARLRDALVKRVGQDYFIERLLEREVSPLDGPDRKKVDELLERLRSDSIIQRDEALAELQKMGPRAAPALKKALGSTDPEFRARIRHLFWTWAEPKPRR